MPITPQITAALTPPGTCYPPDFQSLLNKVAANLIISGLDGSTFFSYGPSTPPTDAQGMPWIKTDAQFGLLGIYTFAGGQWTPQALPFTTGDIMMFNGAVSGIVDPWFPCDGVAGARGFITPDLRGSFIVGTGQRTLPAGSTDTANNYTLGLTGGRETTVLGATNMPAHTHTLLARGPLSLSGGGGGTSFVPNTAAAVTLQDGFISGGNTTGTATGGAANPPIPVPSLPPFYALAFKMYIAPVFP